MHCAGMFRLSSHELVQDGDCLLADFCIVMRQGEQRQGVKRLGFSIVRIMFCDLTHGAAVSGKVLIARATIVTEDDCDGVNVFVLAPADGPVFMYLIQKMPALFDGFFVRSVP